MFCPTCGKELNSQGICSNCGYSENKKEKKKSMKVGLLILGVIILFFAFIMIVPMIVPSDDTGTDCNKMPSFEEVSDAIDLYKEGGIIVKIEPTLNSVYISSSSEKSMSYDDMKLLGYLSACYSAYVRNYDLIWADIYSARTGKRIAKYSKSYGFKIYD